MIRHRSRVCVARPAMLADLGAIVIAANSGGCASSSPAPEPNATTDVLEVQYFPTTVVLDDAALAALQPVTQPGRLVFAHPPASLDAVRETSVLVGPASPNAPYGVLR